MTGHLKFTGKPELQHPSLIIAWSIDAGALGTNVTGYLNRKLGSQSFCQIEPLDFFPLGGVTIKDDLVQFPQNSFYASSGKDLIIFQSTPPGHEWYKFINLTLDVAEQYRVKEIYAIGGMISLAAHTTPRMLVGTFNSPVLKGALSGYNLAPIMDYETPPGQRPTISSYFIWAAGKRNIPGVSLWVPIPFYLLNVNDPRAQKKVLDFFNQRFSLGMDLNDLDDEIRLQNQIIAELRNSFPEIDRSITRLESNLGLSEEDSHNLVNEIAKFLRQKRG